MSKGIVQYLIMAGHNILASQLLTNGGVPPIPRKMLNQRQKRKIKAQTR